MSVYSPRLAAILPQETPQESLHRPAPEGTDCPHSARRPPRAVEPRSRASAARLQQPRRSGAGIDRSPASPPPAATERAIAAGAVRTRQPSSRHSSRRCRRLELIVACPRQRLRSRRTNRARSSTPDRRCRAHRHAAAPSEPPIVHPVLRCRREARRAVVVLKEQPASPLASGSRHSNLVRRRLGRSRRRNPALPLRHRSPLAA